MQSCDYPLTDDDVFVSKPFCLKLFEKHQTFDYHKAVASLCVGKSGVELSSPRFLPLPRFLPFKVLDTIGVELSK